MSLSLIIWVIYEYPEARDVHTTCYASIVIPTHNIENQCASRERCLTCRVNSWPLICSSGNERISFFTQLYEKAGRIAFLCSKYTCCMKSKLWSWTLSIEYIISIIIRSQMKVRALAVRYPPVCLLLTFKQNRGSYFQNIYMWLSVSMPLP